MKMPNVFNVAKNTIAEAVPLRQTILRAQFSHSIYEKNLKTWAKRGADMTSTYYQTLNEWIKARFSRQKVGSSAKSGPLLVNRTLRLAWACQHRHWTVDYWKNVAWSDKSSFQLNRADGCLWVWRQPHEFMDPTCQQGTVQAGGGSAKVWGVWSWPDMGPPIRLNTTMTGDRYVRILCDHLHLFMFIVLSDGLGEFQQDNVTLFTSRIATEWLQEHFSEFRHVHWPPKSPDMNIIEHIWYALQCAFQKRSLPSYSY
ncbi:transposable element Tc1 transposase [Trichonephila clavipes]|nr:transposable element Tc1 transposase [Trichonephila clavipes]